MMTIPNSRRGSALLVVLGMLAFMLFSGLAFSVYMRQSRLPTSFLRRTTTTRQLAKAALAEAIEDIDKAIGNDPHPGLRTRSYSEGELGNFWSHRVFIGEGSSSSSGKSSEKSADGSFYPAYASPDETVPVLTLEGLAYLPPNLINEARYYAQRTPTAKWHAFWFDSGRYAYTAIDVSDYFDVNRIFADRPRAACGSRRISFAHLFEAGYDHSGAGKGAAEWDKFLEKYRSVNDDTDAITFDGSKCPFVSLADFNMAWGSQSLTFGGKSLQNPFYSFVENEGIPYSCGEQETDEAADKYRMMTFVTDGWFPIPTAANKKSATCNLEDDHYQPFKPNLLERDRFSPAPMDLGARLQYSDAAAQKWLKVSGGARIPAPAAVALWDYLDVDSVPVSLCMPTVERTPLISGVKVGMSQPVELAVEKEEGKSSDGTPVDLGGSKWIMRTRQYTYKLAVNNLSDAQKDVQVLLSYPFRDHGKQSELSRSFKVDGRLSVFLADAGQDLSIRPANFSAYPKSKQEIAKPDFTERALISFPLRQQSVTPQQIVSANKKEYPCMALPMPVDKELPNDNFILARVTYTWPCKKLDEESDPPQYIEVHKDPGIGAGNDFLTANTTVNVTDGDIGVFPLKTDGACMTQQDLRNVLANKKSVSLRAYAAVWMRVQDSNQEVVDYVPAWQQDDKNFKQGRSEDRIAESVGGDRCPLMRFASEAGNALDYSLAAFHGSSNSKGSLGSFSVPDTKLVIADPRYNYAPENWVRVVGNSGLTTEDWESAQSGTHSTADGKDGDVFMSTSDAGYMQSIYELAFLPRMSEGLNDDDFRADYNMSGMMPAQFNRADYPTAHADAKDYICMWRTYSPYGTESDFYDLEELMASGSGTKVNPYSDSTKVLMAAFANTPHDWRAASTNDDEIFSMDAETFNGKHAWNAYSSDATGKICWDCLEGFAEQFKTAVRSKKDWETAFAELDWSRDNKRKLLSTGDDLDGDDADLYSVDKKFLYGFWRDCFAARQQLFLVFVRAEPMMMGGGVLGQTPPQLGARAVALVWRDPARTKSASQSGNSSSESFVPHRTRILFYHQFD